MGVSMSKVTVSGHPGSGTSTLVDGLTQHFGWNSINGGEIFRREAENRSLTLAEFGVLCTKDESVDRELDKTLQQYIADNETNIVESRLAGWWAFKMKTKCVRIWLSVSEATRADRVSKREDIALDIAQENNAARLLLDNERYQNMYGILPDDPTPYTHIIDATNISAQEVLEQAIMIMEEF